MKRIASLLVLLAFAGVLPAQDFVRHPRRPDNSHTGPTGPNGEQPMVDLPASQRMKNIGSHVDQAGECVFTSNEMACRWANLEQMRGFRDWVADHYPGGGYPEKLDKLIKAWCDHQKIPAPDYCQYEGSDPSIIELALKTGRMPSITWQANHMLSCVYLDSQTAGILDNNDIQTIHWYDRQTFLQKWTQGGGGWVVVWMAPGPPPIPVNAQSLGTYPDSPAFDAPRYQWRFGGGRADQVFLFRGETQIGGYNYTTRHFFYWHEDKQSWYGPCESPVAVPEWRAVGYGATELVDAGVDYGLCREHIASGAEHYMVNGLEVSQADALELLRPHRPWHPRPRPQPHNDKQPNLPDDSAQTRLTIVADAQTQARLAPLVQSVPGVQVYPNDPNAPDAWALEPFKLAQDRRFQQSHFALFIQPAADKDGRAPVQAYYTVEEAESVLGALRTPDPNYDPNKQPAQPQPSRPTLESVWDTVKVLPQFWFLLALSVVLLSIHLKIRAAKKAVDTALILRGLNPLEKI